MRTAAGRFANRLHCRYERSTDDVDGLPLAWQTVTARIRAAAPNSCWAAQ